MSDDKSTLNGKIVALRSKDITPKIVIDGLCEDVDQFEEIYTVVKLKDGRVLNYMSGHASGLAFAAISFMDLATQYNRGEIGDE